MKDQATGTRTVFILIWCPQLEVLHLLVILNLASQKEGFLNLSFHDIWRSWRSTVCFFSEDRKTVLTWRPISVVLSAKPSLCFVIYFTLPLQGAVCDPSVLLPDQGAQCFWSLVASVTPDHYSRQLLGLRFRLKILLLEKSPASHSKEHRLVFLTTS